MFLWFYSFIPYSHTHTQKVSLTHFKCMGCRLLNDITCHTISLAMSLSISLRLWVHAFISTSTPCSLRIRINWHTFLLLYNFKILLSTILWRAKQHVLSQRDEYKIYKFPFMLLLLLHNQCILHLLFLLTVCGSSVLIIQNFN